nr:hypothetical protein [Paenimyroides ceti]
MFCAYSVYVIIISLVIRMKNIIGFIGLQGLVMTLLYMLGFFASLVGAFILNKVIKTTKRHT